MKLPAQCKRLRIYIGESDKWKNKPLYEAILLKARELGLAGGTVFRGPMGFGSSAELHTSKILQLSMDLPVVVELIDAADKIERFKPSLEQMMQGGLVTQEDVEVLYQG